MTVSEERLVQFIQGIDLYELAQEYDLGCIEHDLKELAEELIIARKATQTLNNLRELMGYVQNGSETKVSLFQDDATMDFMLRVGNKTYWGNYLEQVIDKAFEAEGPRK